MHFPWGSSSQRHVTSRLSLALGDLKRTEPMNDIIAERLRALTEKLWRDGKLPRKEQRELKRLAIREATLAPNQWT